MIIDVTGIELTPRNDGIECLGNGEHCDENGNIIECCCDECDYLICCTMPVPDMCKGCSGSFCPRAKAAGTPS